jgi:hypothetical protein
MLSCAQVVGVGGRARVVADGLTEGDIELTNPADLVAIELAARVVDVAATHHDREHHQKRKKDLPCKK